MFINSLKLSISLLFICHLNIAIAAKNSTDLLEPEECVLEIIKAPSFHKEDRGYIEKQCTKRFINQSQKNQKSVLLNLVSDAVITYGWILFDGNGLIVSLKNNSDKRLVSIVIFLTKKDGSDRQLYKLSAEKIIEPYTFGKFSEANPISINQQYFDDRYWSIISIQGVEK